MTIFSRRIFMTQNELTYAHRPLVTEAHILPNSDMFDIISKCFWAECRSAGMSAPSLHIIAIWASRLFCSRSLEESLEHSNGDGIIAFKTIVPLPAARSARPWARPPYAANGEYRHEKPKCATFYSQRSHKCCLTWLRLAERLLSHRGSSNSDGYHPGREPRKHSGPDLHLHTQYRNSPSFCLRQVNFWTRELY